MNNQELEEAYNNTFPGLTMYYRDCELNQNLISKYEIGQIILEKGGTDISPYAEGLGKNLRYAIVTNKAFDMSKVNPDTKKYNFHLLPSSSYYKIIDIYTVENQTQLLLLNFEEKYLNIFDSTNSNIEEQIVEMGRKSFDNKILLKPNQILYEDEWLNRTASPIGMSDNGEFFLKR